MPLFRFLHASDFHIATVPFLRGIFHGLGPAVLSALTHPKAVGMSSHDPALVRAFLRLVHDESFVWRDLDGILLTGDMATLGATNELQVAKNFLEPEFQAVQGINVPVGMLPGNHDRYQSAFHRPPYGPGNDNFGNVFNSYWNCGQGAKLVLSRLKGNRAVFVLGADFTLPASNYGQSVTTTYGGVPVPIPGYLGQGFVPATEADEPLRTLIDLTQKLQRRRIDGIAPIILWAIHFNPWPGTDPTLELLNSDVIEKAANRLKTPLILCGHTHESDIRPFGSYSTVMIGGTASEAMPPNGLHEVQIIEIDAPTDPVGPDQIRRILYRYQTGRFRQVSTTPIP